MAETKAKVVLATGDLRAGLDRQRYLDAYMGMGCLDAGLRLSEHLSLNT